MSTAIRANPARAQRLPGAIRSPTMPFVTLERVWDVLKWVLLALAAGFIGQFGKSFALRLIERRRQRHDADGSPATPADVEIERARLAAQVKIEKKRAKAEVKRNKKAGPVGPADPLDESERVDADA